MSNSKMPTTAVVVSLALCSVSAVLLLVYRAKKAKENSNKPPVYGPGAMENTKQLTDSSSMRSALHVREVRETVKSDGTTPLGAIFRINSLMTSNFVVVTDHKVARLVFEGDSKLSIQESEKTTIGKNFNLFPDLGSIFSNLTTDLDRKATRKSIAPSFSMTNLKYTFPIMFKCLNTFGSILSPHIGSNSVFDLNEAMIKLTFDIITETNFDVSFDAQHDTGDGVASRYLELTETKLRYGYRNALNPFFKFMFWLPDHKEATTATTELTNILEGIVSGYRNSHSPEEMASDNTIMGHMMRHEYKEDRARVGDMFTFMTAGHETTSHSLTMLIICMCQNPSALATLQAELDQAIPESGRHNLADFGSISGLKSLPYLSYCIDEAIRLWPTIAIGSKRIALADIPYTDKQGKSCCIPKGSLCSLAFYVMFRESWIDNADEFVPERWSPTSSQSKELRSMLMPFALGTRNCIGQNLAKVEMATIAAYLLRFYSFELVSKPVYQIFLSMKATNVSMKVQTR